MANIVYTHITGNRDLLYNMLIVQKLSIAQAAKMLEVPYNCLRNQVLKLFTEKELKKVIGYRERKTYSRAEKLEIMREFKRIRSAMSTPDKVASTSQVAREISKKYKINPSQIYNWVSQFKREAAEKRRLKKEASAATIPSDEAEN